MNEKNLRLWINITRICLTILVALTFLSFWYLNEQNNYTKSYLEHTSDLKVLTQRISKDASEAVINADKNAFKSLSVRINDFSHHLNILLNGEKNEKGKIILPPNTKVVDGPAMQNLLSIWGFVKSQADFILENEQTVLDLYDYTNKLGQVLNDMEDLFTNLINEINKQKNALLDIVSGLSNQAFLAHKIEEDFLQIVGLQVDTSHIEQTLPTKIEQLGNQIEVLRSKINNTEYDPIFKRLEDDYKVVEGTAAEIIRTAGLLLKLYNARQKISDMSDKFLAATDNLEQAYSTTNRFRFISQQISYTLSGITLLTLLLLVYLMRQENILQLKVSESERKLLKTDIQKLVDELEDLASGNLTVKATLGGEITKDIAIAVNYALNALRKLVVTINHSAVRLTSASKNVRKISKELAKASDRQAQEIVQATTSVTAMASSIDLVSSNAKESAIVAEKSVNIAKEGAQVVQNTREGMERIREQIQETEKRVRRLGESSQEIGEIVSLIDGISEQTNILSLNASIQAAMAGEAGRGFAVVADEVQRLAEKSSSATKEVETLVKTIQTDTARAVESMEKAISEVVSGTHLANDAGAALEKIEKVSETLAELIQHISQAAAEQSVVATKISKMMGVIEEITIQTASGSANTNEATSQLVDLVEELHNSVAEFKLPEENNG